MMIKKINPHRQFYYLVAIIIIVAGSIIVFQTYQFNEIQKDYNTKLLLLNENLIQNLNTLRQDVDEEIFLMQSNLTLKLDLVERSLGNFRDKTEQDVLTLGDLISQIEEQSNLQLEELKQEVSSIQVESGDFSSIVEDVIQSVVSIGTDRGQGSGTIFDSDGFIVTNYHVIENARIIRVLTYQGKIYDAQLIGFNELLDLAVIKVEGDFMRLRFGDSDDVKVGQKVIALGNPAGLSFSVTEGIVSAVHRKGPNDLNVYTQTDVPINPGNSGGPLVNTNSRIIGINNFKIGGFESLGFAIESNSVKEVAEDIVEQYLEAQE